MSNTQAITTEQADAIFAAVQNLYRNAAITAENAEAAEMVATSYRKVLARHGVAA